MVSEYRNQRILPRIWWTTTSSKRHFKLIELDRIKMIFKNQRNENTRLTIIRIEIGISCCYYLGRARGGKKPFAKNCVFMHFWIKYGNETKKSNFFCYGQRWEREKINCEFPFKAPSHFAQTERLITHSTNSANKTRKKRKKKTLLQKMMMLQLSSRFMLFTQHSQCIQQISVFQDFQWKRVRKKKTRWRILAVFSI